MQLRDVEDLPDHAAQVLQFDVDVGEVYLPPGIAEAARRVAQHRVPFGERVREVTVATFATAPAVQ